jgi:peptidoglycan L-alanyl-D-glutamate endopeptidase CwlK
VTLGKASIEKLATCHDDLMLLVVDVAARIEAGDLFTAGIRDITVVCGHRGRAEQEKAFQAGNSKLTYPHSKHNKLPSLAVDLAPYPIDWKDREAFMVLRGFVLARAAVLGLKIGVISWDLPHYQVNSAT